MFRPPLYLYLISLNVRTPPQKASNGADIAAPHSAWVIYVILAPLSGGRQIKKTKDMQAFPIHLPSLNKWSLSLRTSFRRCPFGWEDQQVNQPTSKPVNKQTSQQVNHPTSKLFSKSTSQQVIQPTVTGTAAHGHWHSCLLSPC